MNIKNFKKLKKLSVLIITGGAGLETKSRQFTFFKALFVLGLYSLVIFSLSLLIFNITPIGRIGSSGRSNLNPTEKKMINDLNQRLIFITFELEKLKSTNQQLKDAIMLGDSTLIDSLNKPNSMGNTKESPYGGNIFFVMLQLVSIGQDQQAIPIHFLRPVDGYISRGFNPDNGHMGIDFVIKTGTPVYSAAGGYIVFADYTINDGYMIIIAHPDGYMTVYKHCSVLLKKTRDIVSGGELIALSGNTGELSTGPHLHFEIWKNGKPIDPQNLLINN